MDVSQENRTGSNAIVPAARRRLITQDRLVAGSPPVLPIAPPDGFVTDKINLLENVTAELVHKSMLSSHQKVHDQKRQRESEVSGMNATASAISLGEDHRGNENN